MAENYYNSSLTGEEIESRLLGAVLSNATQNISDENRTRARRNIDAAKSFEVDPEPRQGSNNLISSGAVYEAMGGVFAPAVSANPGDHIYFSDGAYEQPFESIEMPFEAIQSGSGDPSPDNVRPISGYNGLTIYQRGRNLVNPASPYRTNATSATYNPVDDSVTVVVNGSYAGAYFSARCFAGKTYRFTAKIDTYRSAARIGIRKSGSSVVVSGTLAVFSASTNEAHIEFTPNETANYYFVVFATYSTSESVTATFRDIMVSYGSGAKVYQQYNGRSFAVSWSDDAGTIFGGNVKYLGTGMWQITKEWAEYVFTGATSEAWDVSSGVRIIRVTGLKPSVAPLCNRFKGVVSSSNTPSSGCVAIRDTNYNVRINPGITIADTAAWRAWLAENNVQLVAKLATPEVYTITTGEFVNSLLGDNYLYGYMTGDVIPTISDLVYRADIGLYLLNNLNPIREMMGYREDGMKATRNYTVGDYIVVNNTFFRVTANISSGATISAGTNVTATTIGAQLKAALS